MKNKFILIILAIFISLSFTTVSVNGNNLAPIEDVVPIEELSSDVSADGTYTDDTMQESSINTVKSEQELPYKQPISKGKLFKKFLLAMFVTLLSSALLYLGLSMYNKIREGGAIQIKTPDGETPLSSPKDFGDAVKIFLNKTKW